MKTTKQQIEIEVPVGYTARWGTIPENSKGTKYLSMIKPERIDEWPSINGSHDHYIILEPDPAHVDTTTEEYRVEVYRQWLRGKAIQCDGGCGNWQSMEDFPRWNWADRVVYRVAPEGTDELGPYYLDGERKCYVPR